VKIQKLGDSATFGPAFALREYVAYDGYLRFAFRVTDLSDANRDTLANLLAQINQLGKRGCFVQLAAVPEMCEELGVGFATPIGSSPVPKSGALLQPLDDMQPNATWHQVDAFSASHVCRDAVRRSVPFLVPYKRNDTSKGFTSYERAHS
jgi:hypothetical protein